MEYVSAELVENGMGDQLIKATGDDGSIWWIPSLLCDVPPWPDFLKTAAGKEFARLATRDELAL